MQTANFVTADRIVQAFIPERYQDNFWDWVTPVGEYGTQHILVGNNFFYQTLVEYMETIDRPMTDEQKVKFWTMVELEAYVDVAIRS